MRFNLAWFPLFGSTLNISWSETLDIPMYEIEDLSERANEQSGKEWKKAFKGK